MKRAALSACVIFLATACSTTTPSAPSAPAPQPSAPPAPAPAPAPAAKAAPVAPAESPMQAFERMRNALPAKSIFFAFDRYTVAPDEASAIEEHAKLAIAYPNDHIVIQGNCDERGGREYNLALGQHRAEAVKSRLEALGVQDARIETVSFGKEKPRAACHEEKCWSVNRRADFVESWR